jgi:hypothetical protein
MFTWRSSACNIGLYQRSVTDVRGSIYNSIAGVIIVQDVILLKSLLYTTIYLSWLISSIYLIFYPIALFHSYNWIDHMLCNIRGFIPCCYVNRQLTNVKWYVFTYNWQELLFNQYQLQIAGRGRCYRPMFLQFFLWTSLRI